MENEVRSTVEMFGLTKQQIKILYSLEYLLTKRDINSNQKDIIYKEHWLEHWSACLQATMDDKITFYTYEELMDAVANEASSSINQTWFYLIMLEGTLFRAYTPLGETKDADKHYQKLHYSDQTSFLKSLANSSGLMDPVFVDRFKKTYQKTINKLSGKMQKVALGAVSVVAISAAAAATAGIFAGPVAVALFGSNFAGVTGAALTSACLAMAGGGAIAVGGAGMAGGVVAIVGGGALLGAAGGGAAVSTVSILAKSMPSFALSQAAKLEVVLKEIILNAQKDVQSAQAVMENLRREIHKLQREIEKLKKEDEEKKDTIKNMKKTLNYLQKSYQDMAVFKSSYEIGAEYEGEE